MNPAAHDDAAGLDGGERQRDEVADRREDQCGVEGLGRRLGGVAGPRGSQRAREALRRRVARPGEREDAPALVARHLRHQVGRRAESVDADALGIARLSQRAVADQPGAQQRPGLDVGQTGRKRMDEACVGDRVLGVAAVQLVAGEARLRAEILVAATAEAAVAARPAEPRHADPVALAQGVDVGSRALHRGDDLVPEDERELRRRQLAVDDVQVGAADAARPDPQQHLARRDGGDRQIGRPQGAARRVEHHRAHVPA